MGKHLSELQDAFGTGFETAIELFTLIIASKEPKFIRAPSAGLAAISTGWDVSTCLCPGPARGVDRIFACVAILTSPVDHTLVGGGIPRLP